MNTFTARPVGLGCGKLDPIPRVAQVLNNETVSELAQLPPRHTVKARISLAMRNLDVNGLSIGAKKV